MIFQFVFMSITVKPLANASSRPFQPFSVTFDTKVTIDCLVLPAFHDGSGSAGCAKLVVKAVALPDLR